MKKIAMTIAGRKKPMSTAGRKKPMSIAGRSMLIIALFGTVAGCGRFKEVRMVDPRTGVAATCRSTRYNLLTTSTVVNEVNACIQELTYYGFQDEDSLIAATKPRG